MKWNLVSLIFFISIPVLSQNINVSKLKSSYKRGEKVEFDLQNVDTIKLSFDSFVLESFYKPEGEWFEVVYDVLSNSCNELTGKEGFILLPNESRKITWNPKMISPKCFNYKKHLGLYRLTIKISSMKGVKYFHYKFKIK